MNTRATAPAMAATVALTVMLAGCLRPGPATVVKLPPSPRVTATAKGVKKSPYGRPVMLSKPWRFKNLLSLKIEAIIYVNKSKLKPGPIRFVGPTSVRKGLTRVSVTGLRLIPDPEEEQCPTCSGKKRLYVKALAVFTYHVRTAGVGYDYGTEVDLGEVPADECYIP